MKTGHGGPELGGGGWLDAARMSDISNLFAKTEKFFSGKTSENIWGILTNEVGAGIKRVVDFKHLIVDFS